ncbi:hypothetical protein ACIPRL_35265, partial [Streptomyces sp. NPDC090085]|uniref:hypothetical protein n=1 Tax=Streptomyces sp. NPDC090085 TaxID=3365943 RepID=UPI003825CB35
RPAHPPLGRSSRLGGRLRPISASPGSCGTALRGWSTSSIKAEKKPQKKGFIANIRAGDFRGAWNVTAGSSGWWKHTGVNLTIGVVAAAGTAACIASVVCGGGLFLVGAAALFTAGLGAHMAVASEEERARGATQFLLPTAKAEASGMIAGATFGRGLLGGLILGPKQGIAGPGLTTRGASDPLFAGLARTDYAGIRGRVVTYMKNLF